MTDTILQPDLGTAPGQAADSGQAADEKILSDWLSALHSALSARDSEAVKDLLRPDAVVRDLLAFSWDFRNAVGRDEAVDLLTGGDSTPPVSIDLRSDRSPIRADEGGASSLASFFLFRTDLGGGQGYLRLVEDEPGVWRAAAASFVLDSLDSHPKRLDALRPVGKAKGPVFDRLSWAEETDGELREQDPAVVILGAGHNGLMLAARLEALGVPTLVVEKNERVGDNWRKRYGSLALHTPLTSDSFPYLPFPPTWPRFTPKDRLADFLESYASLLGLRVWTGSQAENVRFDEDEQRWNMDVVRPDGSTRALSAGHLVFATGMLSEPLRPDLPGQELYRGTVMHTADYRDHRDWVGKRALVVGTGVSGHDIAQDLAEHGAEVTMVQRSATVVFSISSFHEVMHANHVSGAYTVEEADLVNSAVPFGDLPRHGAAQLATANERDRELLDGLAAAGFEVGVGPDGTGVLGLIFGQNSTGYYYNAGASELLVDGTIALAHGNVVGFTERGVRLEDGSTLDADLVILGTGYRGADAPVRRILGDEVADRLGAFANVSPDREYGRLWRASGIDRLWLMTSLGIGDGRFYSNLLALQIAALEA